MWKGAHWLLALAAVVSAPHVDASAPTLSKVETTEYTYNADGALMKVVEKVTEDGRVDTPITTYLTWDNCTPQEGQVVTCSTSPGNGNLLGIGRRPGDESRWSAHYDVLDRLTQVTNAQRQTAVYRYHPDELLAASLNAQTPSSDGLQHYYDQSRYPQVTNFYDRNTGTLSARYRSIRYMPDGTEQLLVRHRKDIDGVYDPILATMTAYRYDPYGRGTEGSALTTSTEPLYRLDTNPFQYSAELRDPVSGADYLRARWYLPEYQTFVQRDPVANLNRFGYAHANPIRNHDPSGRSPTRFGRWFAGLNPFEQGFFGGVSLGIIPVVVTARAEGRAFWAGRHALHNWLMVAQIAMSVATLAGDATVGAFAARISTGRTQIGDFSAASAILGVGGTLGLGQSALQFVAHPQKRADIASNLLGGLAGGAMLSLTSALAGRQLGDVIKSRRVDRERAQIIVEDARSNLPPLPSLERTRSFVDIMSRVGRDFRRSEDGVFPKGSNIPVDIENIPQTQTGISQAIETLQSNLEQTRQQIGPVSTLVDQYGDFTPRQRSLALKTLKAPYLQRIREIEGLISDFRAQHQRLGSDQTE